MTMRPESGFDGQGQRTAAVAECAYFKAERRGFLPGFELDDWLAAEREIGGASEPRPPSAVEKSAKSGAPKLKGVEAKPRGAAKTKKGAAKLHSVGTKSKKSTVE